MNLALLSEITIDPEFKSIAPPLTEGEFEQLEENIITEGCRDAIVLWNNIIIDGHNRYEICQKHNLPYSTVDKNFTNREAVIEWMILNQLGRRNISAYDRVRLALKLKPIIAEKAKENQATSTGGDNPQLLQKSAKAVINTREELASTAGVSHDTIAKVEKIEANAIPEVKEKIRSGDLSIHAASQLSKAPEEEQEKIIDKIVSGEAKSVRQAIISINKEKADTLAATPLILPQGKYQTIEIDPPWKMNGQEAKSQVMQYPLMELQQIIDLGKEIDKIADINCHLYLWVINPMLPESFEVLKAWEQYGFVYKTCITWVKSNGFGTGHYYRGQTEHVLLAVKGSLKTNRNDQANYFEAARYKHSQKPQKFYEIIESMSPAPRIRLFARSPRDGWDSWGNEA